MIDYRWGVLVWGMMAGTLSAPLFVVRNPFYEPVKEEKRPRCMATASFGGDCLVMECTEEGAMVLRRVERG